MNRRKLRIGTLITTIAALVVACSAVAVYLSDELPKTIDSDLFPDDALRTYVEDKVDRDGDGKLSVDEASDVRIIVIDSAQSLSGLSAFPNLETVVAGGAGLKSVEIKDTPSLTRLDLSGAENLTSLVITNTLSLQNVDIRGTNLDAVDFSKAGHLKQVLANPSTELKGLTTASTTKTSLPTRFRGVNTGSDSYQTGDFDVEATYDDEGKLQERTISGDAQASVSYSYDDHGLLDAVQVDGAGDDLSGSWTLDYANDAVVATGPDESQIVRGYDRKGRLVSLSVSTVGTEGPIQGDLAFGYDARGFLNSVTVQSGDTQTDYDVACNGAGIVEAITSSDGSAGFFAWAGSSLSDAGIVDNDQSTMGRVTSDGRFYGSITRDQNGDTSRLVAKFGSYVEKDAEEGAEHRWGRISSADGAVQYRYDVDYEQFSVSAGFTSPVAAISMTDKTSPSPYVDYWFVDDLDTVVRLAIEEAVDHQWSMGSTDPILSEVYNADALEQYESRLPEIAEELGVDQSEMRYALVSLGYDSKPQLAVTDSEHTDSLLAVYSIVDDDVRQVKRAEDDEAMYLCGGGYLRTESADGNQTVEYFTGIAFDEVAFVRGGVYDNIYLGVAQPDDGTANSSLQAAYPSAMASIEWSASE